MIFDDMQSPSDFYKVVAVVFSLLISVLYYLKRISKDSPRLARILPKIGRTSGIIGAFLILMAFIIGALINPSLVWLFLHALIFGVLFLVVGVVLV